MMLLNNREREVACLGAPHAKGSRASKVKILGDIVVTGKIHDKI